MSKIIQNLGVCALIITLAISITQASLPRITSPDDISIIGGCYKCPNGYNCAAACENAQEAKCDRVETKETTCKENCGGSHGCGPRSGSESCGGCDTTASGCS